MNRYKLLFWIFTTLFSGFMLLGAIPDLLRTTETLMFFRHLGYPPYLLPFLGTAKALGVAAILCPGFRRLKEWAYAGLAFDLIGAVYSHVSVGDPIKVWGVATV